MFFRKRSWEERYRRDLSAAIRRYGWTAVGVDDPGAPYAWHYTVGFAESLDHPELIAFGLPPVLVNEAFWSVFRSAKRDGLTLADGQRWSLPGVADFACRAVHPRRITEEGWLFFAKDRHLWRTGALDGFSAFQLTLVGSNGATAWEPGYDPELGTRTVLLHLPPEAGPLARETDNPEVAANGGV